MIGPFFLLELTVAARRRRTYVLRALVGTALFLGFSLAYAEEFQWAFQNDDLTASTKRLAEFGGLVFWGWTCGSFGALLLFLPPMVCPAIAREKLHRAGQSKSWSKGTALSTECWPFIAPACDRI